LLIGELALIFSLDYFITSDINVTFLLLSLLSILIVTFIGFMDDMAGSKIRTAKIKVKTLVKNYSQVGGGLKQREKLLLTLIGVLPLLVINFGPGVIPIPHVGTIYLNQLLFTFIVIPIIFLFSSNVFNMLEGLNGLSLQMGLIAVIAMGILSFHYGDFTEFSLSAVLSGSLIAYLYYGSYPAKILPGDSFTYFIGSAFAVLTIIGSTRALALILILPWLAEFALKARGRFHVHSWGVLQKDGRLTSPNGNRIYSLTHLFLRTGKFKEWQIVLSFTLLEFVLAVIGLIIFW
ncbi:MAG: hypothetical protein QXU98_11585, partial [Candidatus Parvarchaeota archaeon]